MQFVTAAQAAASIPNAATVAISGGGYRAVAESMLEEIARRFDQEGAPNGLRLISVSMLERTRGGVGGEGTGLNRLAKPGLLAELICSSFSRAPDREINKMIHEDKVAAWNYPMGSIVQWLRGIGAGRAGLFTEAGLGTYVDPRVEGGMMNAAATRPLNRIVEVEGRTMLYYPSMAVDVALIRASASDERGNLYCDNQVYDHGSLDVAMAARASGGVVIAEVDRIIKRGDLPARMVRIPGGLIDKVVVNGQEPWEDEQAPVLLGITPVDLPPPAGTLRPRDVIAALAVDLVPEGAMVNVGAGIPMYDVPEQARRLGREDIYFTVEQGPAGGWPQVGGVSRNPEAVLNQLDVFDMYEGGCPDVSILSFGEMDAEGNVNVSRFGAMMPGCGGFINIVHGVRRLIFCGTLTTGGLDLAVGEGRLKVVKEGRIKRFVDKVQQVTFNAQRALAANHEITVITERGIFAVTDRGWQLNAVSPGIDVARDILGQVPFPIHIAPDLRTLPSDMFKASVVEGAI